MRQPPTIRYCAPPDVVRLLEKDGLGWGHDLECGLLPASKLTQKKDRK